MTRKITNKVLELAADGVISWESLATAALAYMSEDDVIDFAESEGYIEWDEEDED
jgi:hypothetical protein